MSEQNPGFLQQVKSFPRAFWVANTMEIFERLSWYGWFGVMALYVTAPPETGGLGFSTETRGNLMGIVPFFLYLMPVLTGALAERYGYKKMFIVAFSIMIAAYYSLGQFTSLPGFFMAFMFLAVGAAIFKPVVVGTVARVTNDGNSSMGFGIFYMMVNVGGFAGPIVAGIVRGWSWDWVFIACSTWAAVNLVIVLVFYKEPEVEGPKKTKTLRNVLDEMVEVIGNLRFFLTVFVVLFALMIASLGPSWFPWTACLVFIPAWLVLNFVWDAALPKDSGTAKDRGPLAKRMYCSNWRFAVFLLIMSGFWTAFNQIFITMPEYIRDFTETQPLIDAFESVFGDEENPGSVAEAVATVSSLERLTVIDAFEELKYAKDQGLLDASLLELRARGFAEHGIKVSAAQLRTLIGADKQTETPEAAPSAEAKKDDRSPEERLAEVLLATAAPGPLAYAGATNAVVAELRAARAAGTLFKDHAVVLGEQLAAAGADLNAVGFASAGTKLTDLAADATSAEALAQSIATACGVAVDETLQSLAREAFDSRVAGTLDLTTMQRVARRIPASARLTASALKAIVEDEKCAGDAAATCVRSKRVEADVAMLLEAKKAFALDPTLGDDEAKAIDRTVLAHVSHQLLSSKVRLSPEELRQLAERESASAGLATKGIAQGRQFNPEFILNINAGAIVIFQILVSFLMGRFHQFSTMIVGMIVAGVGIGLSAFAQAHGMLGAGGTVWLVALGLLTFSFGEMMASPTSQEYVGRIAPRDKKALYMGYYFVAVALGNLFGGILSGQMYGTLARDMQRPDIMWAIFGLLMFGTAILFVLYNRFALPKTQSMTRE